VTGRAKEKIYGRRDASLTRRLRHSAGIRQGRIYAFIWGEIAKLTLNLIDRHTSGIEVLTQMARKGTRVTIKCCNLV